MAADAQQEHPPGGDVSSTDRWDRLYQLAEPVQGCFTREQALSVGISPQLVQKHLDNGSLQRLHRGIYRFSRFPAAGRTQEDLIVVWLWSSQEGTFSHETALQLRGLTDALPGRVHLTVPLSWRHRKVTPPPSVVLAYADLAPEERSFVEAVPVTTAARTLNDVALAHGDADLVERGVHEAIGRRLAVARELGPAVGYVARGVGPFALRTRSAVVAGIDRYGVVSLTGNCTRRPAADWRIDAEAFAEAHGARLFEADFDVVTHQMRVALVWPGQCPPAANGTLLQAAQVAFGWR